MRKKDTQRPTKEIFDLYWDSVEDVIDNDIDNEIPSRNNPL